MCSSGLFSGTVTPNNSALSEGASPELSANRIISSVVSFNRFVRVVTMLHMHLMAKEVSPLNRGKKRLLLISIRTQGFVATASALRLDWLTKAISPK